MHARNDTDFLVTFTTAAQNDLAAFAEFNTVLLDRSVDAVERPVETQ